MTERKLTGESNSFSAKDGGKLTPDDPSESGEPTPVNDLETDIFTHTQNGGLKALPSQYEGINGFWRTVRSENLFEVLYLDHRLYRTITAVIVEGNYNILLKFWQEKNLFLNTGARQNLIRIYEGETTIENAESYLDKAFTHLKTQAGIEEYHRVLDQNRLKKGKEAISEIVDVLLEDGNLTKAKGIRIINKGISEGLLEEEIRHYLINEKLIPLGFSARSKTRHDDFLDDEWKTDIAVQGEQSRKSIAIKVFDRQAASLKELGKILFDIPERTKNEFIHSIAYLPAAVYQIEGSDSRARFFESIITDEKDTEKRYLKIIYHLNPALPFRIDSYEFNYLTDVFKKTKDDNALFLKAVESYGKGYFHIWLIAADKKNAEKLTEKTDSVSFLRLLYNIAPAHPFFLNGERFDTPQLLIKKAQTDYTYWKKIIDNVSNNSLPVWFEGIGKSSWNDSYNKAITPIFNSAYYSDDDKKLACVQALIQIIDPLVPNPKIVSVTQKVEELSVNASKQWRHKIDLKLQYSGFAKTHLHFDNPLPGLALSSQTLDFNTLAGKSAQELFLLINPLLFIKNKVYNTNLVIETIHQTVTIPITIKVIFPKSVYIKYMLKYACFGVPFFIMIRLLLAAFTNNGRSYIPYIPTFRSYLHNLPENYPAFIVTMILMFFGIWAGYFVTKNIEKL